MLAVSAGTTLAGTMPCDRASLYASLKDAEESVAPPKLKRVQGAWIARLGLLDSPLAMDGFKYDALVDSSTGRAWLVQFAGIAGSVRWFGPVRISTESLLACPEVKSAKLLSERAAARAKAASAGAL